MPNHVESAKRVIEFIATELSEETFVDIMAQYQPYYQAKHEDVYEEINRPITRKEYNAVIEHARAVGLERLYLNHSGLQDRGPFG